VRRISNFEGIEGSRGLDKISGESRNGMVFPSLAPSANISSWQRRSKIGGAAAQFRILLPASHQPQKLGRYGSCTLASKRPGPALKNPSAFPRKS